MASIEIESGYDCGWWAPGDGEPGTEWVFTPARLKLTWDGPGESLDVQVLTASGPRALAAVPVEGIARAFAAGVASDG